MLAICCCLLGAAGGNSTRVLGRDVVSHSFGDQSDTPGMANDNVAGAFKLYGTVVRIRAEVERKRRMQKRCASARTPRGSPGRSSTRARKHIYIW